MPVFLTERGEGLALPGWKDRAVVGTQEVPRKPDSNPALGRWVGWWAGAAGVRGALGPRAFAMFPGSLRVREESCPAAAWASLSEKGRC